jgi:hypothetical protein
MSLAEVEAPVSARPELASAIQTVAPFAGPVQPEGRLSAAAEVADAAEVEVAVEMTAVKSGVRLEMAEETAKRVRASGPPQMELESPEQAMLHLPLVLVRAAPPERVLPQ